MADIELVIKIPEEDFEYIKNSKDANFNAIKNGTPLPAKHGDLVDRDEINSRFNAICDELESLSNAPSYKELLDKLCMCLDTANPVIENNYEEAEEELWR